MGENIGNVLTPVSSCAGGAFVEPIRWSREQQGPLSHVPAVPEGQETSPAWIPTTEPQFVGVFLRFGSRQREERAQNIAATCRNVGSPPLRDTVTPLGTEAPQQGQRLLGMETSGAGGHVLVKGGAFSRALKGCGSPIEPKL